MMSWLDRLNGDSLSWLCEPDPVNPGIRYFALRDLLDRSADDPEVLEARSAIMTGGPVPVILNAQHPDGYWQQPGGGYGKYQGTVWQIMLLSELGADPTDERVRRGCNYVLDHGIASNGGFAYNKTVLPSGVVHCLNGNLLYALIRLGCLDDSRLQQALDWQARAITGEDPIQYYQSGTSGPDFACAINEKQPCAWGATKAMKALIAVQPAQRTSILQRALERGAQFLLRYDLAKADYPYTGKVSSTWFKLGFPLSYWSDVLETLAVLVALGYGGDPRLAKAYHWLLSKQDAQGRWKLENSLNGKMWIDIEKRGQSSKWITLRALRVLKEVA
ncbi:MAG: prenyltransferase/squalene oxidase repeat-containing protein [Aggregatilineales bacterium]